MSEHESRSAARVRRLAAFLTSTDAVQRSDPTRRRRDRSCPLFRERCVRARAGHDLRGGKPAGGATRRYDQGRSRRHLSPQPSGCRSKANCSKKTASSLISKRWAFAIRSIVWAADGSSRSRPATATAGRVRSAALRAGSRLGRGYKRDVRIFRKVLIANRGEIALRINRACQELGVRTVAIFSEADRESLHVRQADEAFCVGPGAACRVLSQHSEHHLDGADHAAATRSIPATDFWPRTRGSPRSAPTTDSVFIGPRPSVIAAMGDKATAKAVMREAGVATTPGSDIRPERARRARRPPKQIGYPVLLKATAGGGGKGMRVVERPDRSRARVRQRDRRSRGKFQRRARCTSKSSSRIRATSRCKCSATQSGNVVHLGERDCSVQKPSHQKLIEESPAPQPLRAGARVAARNGRSGLRARRLHQRRNARVSRRGDDVYFMEMNTRIQVEHPGYRDGLRHRSREGADPDRGRAKRSATRRAISSPRPRDRVPDQRGGSAQQLRSAGRHHFERRVSRRPRNPGGHAPVCGRRRCHPTTIRCWRRSSRTAIRARRRSRAWNARSAKRSIEGVHTTIELCLEILASRAVSLGPLRRRDRCRRCCELGGLGTSGDLAAVRAGTSVASIVFDRGRTATSRRTRWRRSSARGADASHRRLRPRPGFRNARLSARKPIVILGPLLEGWTIERLPTIDRLLLQMATLRTAARHRHAAGGRDQRSGRARKALFDRRLGPLRQRRAQAVA